MEFNKDSSKLVKWLTPQLRKHMIKDTKHFEKYYLVLYNEINNGIKYANNKLGTKCLESTLEKEKNVLINNSGYFPKEIQSYIKTYLSHHLTYTCTIQGRKITIMFGIFGDLEQQNLENYDEYALFIYSWLYVCYKHTIKSCSKTLIIKIYLTSQKKTLPLRKDGILGANEVNSAFTYGCQPSGEIILYRAEEWKKVFIHETFHTFGFDFNKNNAKKIYEYHKNKFSIQSEYNIEEAYVETWARIINSAYNSYYSLKNKADTETFLIYFKFSLQIERLFSLHQLNKILEHMGLTFEVFCDQREETKVMCRELFREKSNVLAYYIITGILMSDYNGFIEWCYKHNSNMFKFNASNLSINSFITFIDSIYSADDIFLILQNLRKKNREGFINKTTRMSAIEIID